MYAFYGFLGFLNFQIAGGGRGLLLVDAAIVVGEDGEGKEDLRVNS